MWHVVIDPSLGPEAPIGGEPSAVGAPEADALVGRRYRRVVLGEKSVLGQEVAWPGGRAVLPPDPGAAPGGSGQGAKDAQDAPPSTATDVRSPMAARVLAVHVVAKQRVLPGQLLMLIEAMKMEHPVVARAAQTLASVAVTEGELVAHGQILCTFDKTP